MTQKEKKERFAQVVEALKEYYPSAECALEYEGDPWRLLVMGRLSAQCTDARVNIVCKELFAKLQQFCPEFLLHGQDFLQRIFARFPMFLRLSLRLRELLP